MSERIARPMRIVHRWIGLALAIPLLIQGATGLVLSLTPVFEAAGMPPARHSAISPHGIGAIVAAALVAAPEGLIPSLYQPGPTPIGPAIVDLTRPGQRPPELRVVVDPATLEILDWRDRPDEFYLWAHSLHETFLVPGPVGHGIVGWFGVGLFSLGLSGMVIWWPRRGQWKAALTVPMAARGYRLQRALHGATGGWVGAFLILQSLSGASMAFPGFFGMLLGAPPSRLPSSIPRGTGQPDLDAAVAVIRAAVPGAALISLRLPTRPDRPMIAALLPDGQAAGAPPVIVASDPFSGRILSVRDPRVAGTGAGILAWLRAIHSGGGLGRIWRAINCLLGVALPLFPITGVSMWLLRRRGRLRLVTPSILRGATE